jgi:hypothetical protein
MLGAEFTHGSPGVARRRMRRARDVGPGRAVGVFSLRPRACDCRSVAKADRSHAVSYISPSGAQVAPLGRAPGSVAHATNQRARHDGGGDQLLLREVAEGGASVAEVAADEQKGGRDDAGVIAEQQTSSATIADTNATNVPPLMPKPL